MGSITCMDGFTVTVGQRVRVIGGGMDGFGTVRAIVGDRAMIDPEEGCRKEGGGYWLLNPLAVERHGRPDYWEARDNGVSLGCIERPWWGWHTLEGSR